VTANAPAVTVSIAPLVVSATASPTAGDAPLAVAFKASATGGTAPLSYAWTFGDGAGGAGTAPSHTYSAAGSYVATLTVTDATAQKATAQVTVVVSPALSVSAAASPLVVDQGDNVSFSATPSGGLAPYGYSWNFGDGSPASTTQNPSHAYSSAAAFTAILTVTDGNGVKATASVLVTVHLLPAISAAASPSAGDAPVTVSLSSSPSGGSLPYSYSWDFGDGSALGSTQNASHLYGSAGNYTAAVTLTDAAGHSVKASVLVTVSPALGATAGASPNTGQAPLTVSLSATPSGGRAPYGYSWNFGDGTALGTAQNPTHVYANAGTYTPSVTVTDANGARATAIAPAVAATPTVLTVSVSASPTAGDAPQAVTFSAAASGGTAPVAYAWTFGDGSTGTGATPSHSYTAAGSYVATVTATDAGSQKVTGQVAITVSPALTLTVGASPLAVDQGDAVTFSGSPGGGLPPYAYSWNFGDGSAASTSQNPGHAYSAAGTYTATLTVTDANTVKTTATAQVSVNLLPAVSAAANPSGGDAPLNVSLSAVPTGGTLPYTFSWNFGDGSATSSTQNPSHVYGTAGTFTAHLTLTDAAGHSANASVVIAVSPTLSATAGVSPTTGQAPLSVNLTATPAGGK